MSEIVKANSLSRLSFGSLMVFSSIAAFGQQVKLTPVTEGAVKMIGYYRPIKVEVADGVGSVTKVPADLKSPSYGVIQLQGKSFGVIIDRPDDADYRLFVDSNGNGDFQDDPAIMFVKKDYQYSKDGPKFKMYQAYPKVEIKLAGKVVPAAIGLYMFDKNDEKRPQLKNVFLYYPDFAESGKVKFGKQQFNFLVSDPAATLNGPVKGEAQLLIDRKGNSKYGSKENVFKFDEGFNLDGKTREVASVSFEDGKIKFAPSKKEVAEVAVSPSLQTGDKVVKFTATTMGGTNLDFPSAYHGKVVLLDFWATWCGPCMAEVPNVVANYNKFHAQGFEILGVSLDNAETTAKIGPVTKENGMTWDQICDSKFWDARIAKLYAVQAIPQAYLVDGNTGKIIAQGEELRGTGLAAALTKALAASQPKQPK